MSGIQERFIRAVTSAHLRSDAFDGDIDVIGAAGMSGEPRGATFARLRREFDEAHASLKRQAPDEDAINLRLAAVLRLRSLASAKIAAAELSEDVAVRIKVRIADTDLKNVVWQALSVWLDPTCGHCGGRGYNGGYDGPVQTCRHCRGSGKRRGNTGRNDDERLFIDRLAMQIQESMGDFHRRVDVALR